MRVRYRGRLSWAVLALMIAAVSLVTGCLGMGENHQTTIVPESDFARMIHDVYVLIFWLAVLVFVVVEGALVYAVWRYRARPTDGIPAQVHGNTRLEVAWTIAPAVVLFIIAVPTIQTIFAASAPPPGGEPLRVQVIGHQWWWEFRYPDANVVTASEAHIPAGRPVAFEIESADVIHSFWIPKLGGKLDAIPNRTNTMYLTADRPGEYYGQCVEFCGTQHANMKLRVVVETPEGFEAWLRAQQAPASEASQALPGAQVFQRSACVGCHTIQGTPASGKVGPDLTHLGSRLTLAGAMLENTPENLALWLRDPQEVKPGNKMPDLNLPEQDIAALVEYLRSLQ